MTNPLPPPTLPAPPAGGLPASGTEYSYPDYGPPGFRHQVPRIVLRRQAQCRSLRQLHRPR